MVETEIALFFKVLPGADGQSRLVDLRIGEPQTEPSSAMLADAWLDAEDLTHRKKVLLAAQGARLWRDGDDTAYADIEVRDHDGHLHTERHPVNGSGFRRWLLRQFSEMFPTILPDGTRMASAPPAGALKEALATLEAQAAVSSVREPVVRIGEHDRHIYVDLADERWRAVEIDADGWRVVDNPPVAFLRPNGMRSLPEPVRPVWQTGDPPPLHRLANLINVGDVQAEDLEERLAAQRRLKLVIGYLVACCRPHGPYPILSISGEQGSAKSFLIKALRCLIDPNRAALRRPPKSISDLELAAWNSWVIALDNLSKISNELSDALCCISTGAGQSTRKFFTNGEEFLLEYCRPIAFNGIANSITRGDLAERTIPLVLPTIAPAHRMEAEEAWAAVEAAQPELLGALFNAVSAGLRDLSRTRQRFRGKGLPRLADVMVWVEACSTGIGWTDADGTLTVWSFGETFADTYWSVITEGQVSTLETDPIAATVIGLMSGRTSERLRFPGFGEATRWEGTATELLGVLGRVAAAGKIPLGKQWPTAAHSLSGRLRRLAPALRVVGIEVAERQREAGTGRRGIVITQRSQTSHRTASERHTRHSVTIQS